MAESSISEITCQRPEDLGDQGVSSQVGATILAASGNHEPVAGIGECEGDHRESLTSTPPALEGAEITDDLLEDDVPELQEQRASTETPSASVNKEQAAELERLFRTHYSSLVTIGCSRFGIGIEDAEDLVQTTFIKVARALQGEGYTDVGLERGWLIQVMRNTFISKTRKRQDEPGFTDERIRILIDSDPERSMPSAERVAVASLAATAVVKALREIMPKKESGEEDGFLQVLAATADDCTYLEIAAMLGISPATVRTRLHRARSKAIAAPELAALLIET